MKRIFCDLCGEEVTDDTDLAPLLDITGYAKGRSYNMSLIVSVKRDLVYTGAGYEVLEDICRHCVIDAVNKVDKRPKADPLYEAGNVALINELRRRGFSISGTPSNSENKSSS